MAKLTYEKIYSSQLRLSGVTVSNIFYLIAPVTGTISKIWIQSGANLPVAAKFNVFRNNTSLFAEALYPTIAIGAKLATKTNLVIPVIFGDIITVDMMVNPQSPLLVPLTLIIEFDDGVVDEGGGGGGIGILSGDVTGPSETNTISKFGQRDIDIIQKIYLDSSQYADAGIWSNDDETTTTLVNGIATLAPGSNWSGFSSENILLNLSSGYIFEFSISEKPTGSNFNLSIKMDSSNDLSITVVAGIARVFSELGPAANSNIVFDWTNTITKFRFSYNPTTLEAKIDAYTTEWTNLLTRIDVPSSEQTDVGFATYLYSSDGFAVSGSLIFSEIISNIVIDEPIDDYSFLTLNPLTNKIELREQHKTEIRGDVIQTLSDSSVRAIVGRQIYIDPISDLYEDFSGTLNVNLTANGDAAIVAGKMRLATGTSDEGSLVLASGVNVNLAHKYVYFGLDAVLPTVAGKLQFLCQNQVSSFYTAYMTFDLQLRTVKLGWSNEITGGSVFPTSTFLINDTFRFYRIRHNFHTQRLYFEGGIYDDISGDYTWTVIKSIVAGYGTSLDTIMPKIVLTNNVNGIDVGPVNLIEFSTDTIGTTDSLTDDSILVYNSTTKSFDPMTLTELKAALASLP